jgi:hypothetical protein
MTVAAALRGMTTATTMTVTVTLMLLRLTTL